MLVIVHFAVGATAGVLLSSVLGLNAETYPKAMVASGLWAMIPDIGKPIPVIDPLALHGIEGNLFWFHSVLDALETAYPSVEGMVALFGLVLAVMATSHSSTEKIA